MSVAVLEREIYSLAEAARLLRLPSSTLQWWLEGGERHGKLYPPVLRLEPTSSPSVTWGEFVEAGYLYEYRRRKVSLQQLRPVIDMLRERLDVPYPLAHAKPFVAEGRRLVLEIQEEVGLPVGLWMVIGAKPGQLVLAPPADAFFERVEFGADEDSWAERIYPLGKESKTVVIDPEKGFGAPTVRGIRTEALVELVDAGEPLEVVAEEFSLALADLKVALAYEWYVAAA